jgi:CRISPR-associated protein Csx17
MTREPLHIHRLVGCAPTPLAHYLKALAILRLVGEQADADARGWWQDDEFMLASTLDASGLREFFLVAYNPTPILAPWNSGSGFFDEESTVAEFEKAEAQRFVPIRDAIATARNGATAIQRAMRARRDLQAEANRLRAAVRRGDDTQHARLTQIRDQLAEVNRGIRGDKMFLVPVLRQRWRGAALDWLSSVVVVTEDSSLKYPGLLAIAGADGNLEFTNNFLHHLIELFDVNSPSGAPLPPAGGLLSQALFRTPTTSLPALTIGQFAPASCGGPNGGAGFTGKVPGNPWDFIFMLEGAVCFASGLSQRTLTSAASNSPFAVPNVTSDAAGYASAAAEANSRGEQWLPLWSRPATISELRAMLTEGRRQLGRVRAESSLEMARATARIGVSRGITAFERYGYFERNGRSYLAVPLGRWIVREQPNQRLLDNVQGWVSALSRAARDKQAPAGFSRVARLCQDAILACCQKGHDHQRWQMLLVALGEAERAMSCSPRFASERRLSALPLLDPDWLMAADDGSPEFLLACAVASLAFRSDAGKWDRHATARRYFVPLDRHHRIDASADAPLAAVIVGPRRVRETHQAVGSLVGEISSWALARLPLWRTRPVHRQQCASEGENPAIVSVPVQKGRNRGQRRSTSRRRNQREQLALRSIDKRPSYQGERSGSKIDDGGEGRVGRRVDSMVTIERHEISPRRGMAVPFACVGAEGQRGNGAGEQELRRAVIRRHQPIRIEQRKCTEAPL